MTQTHSDRKPVNRSGTPVDIHIGDRLRQRRVLLGLTQAQLSEVLCLSFQQIQKYEKGTNRISASRLFSIAQVLDVPVSFFFDLMEGGQEGASPGGREQGFSQPDLEMVRVFRGLTRPQQQALYGMARSILASTPISASAAV